MPKLTIKSNGAAYYTFHIKAALTEKILDAMTLLQDLEPHMSTSTQLCLALIERADRLKRERDDELSS